MSCDAHSSKKSYTTSTKELEELEMWFHTQPQCVVLRSSRQLQDTLEVQHAGKK